VSVLNLSEVKNDNETLRYDAEYFQKVFLTFAEKVKNCVPLKNLVASGYRVVYESTQVIEPEIAAPQGFPVFLQATDLDAPFIKTDNFSYVDESDWIRYTQGRIKKGEILIEVKGKAEKVAFVPDNFPEKVLVSGSLFKLTVNQKINKYYLLTYLVSRYGQAFKERTKTNLLISYISKPDLYKIPIPIFSQSFQTRIESLVKSAHAALGDSKRLYAEAEALLLSELGLPASFQDKEASTVAVKSFQESFGATGRLDAEYYQPKYDRMMELLRTASPKSIVPLQQLLTTSTNGHTPSHHDLSIGDVHFLTAEHISDFRVRFDTTKRILTEHHFGELNRTRLHKGDILITIKGKIGNAAIVEDVPFETNINQDVALVRLKLSVHPYYFAGFLNSYVGKAFVNQICTGQINPFLSLENLRNLQIPVFEEEKMSAIGTNLKNAIDKALLASSHSKHLLTLAKRAVETAIERGEVAGVALLAAEGV
jgi:restriction endonuclease S subunit